MISRAYGNPETGVVGTHLRCLTEVLPMSTSTITNVFMYKQGNF